jgi:hypothetical protein
LLLLNVLGLLHALWKLPGEERECSGEFAERLMRLPVLLNIDILHRALLV